MIRKIIEAIARLLAKERGAKSTRQTPVYSGERTQTRVDQCGNAYVWQDGKWAKVE